MTAPRRPRTKRVSTGKRLALTGRDLAIFAALARYRYLRSTYLHAFAGGASETRFKERLGDLFHEGYIDRPAQQWKFANARHAPAVYEIGPRALRILGERGDIDTLPRTYLSGAAHRQFAHSVLICACLASFEIATVAEPNLRFIPWGEVLARAPETTRASATPFRLVCEVGASVVPDAVFGLEDRATGTATYRFFALEVDRGTMPVSRTDTVQSSLAEKFRRYEAFVASGGPRRQLGVSSFIVLTLTVGDTRLRTSLRAAENLGEPGRYLCKAIAEPALSVPQTGLLLEPWERAVSGPVVLVGGTSTHPA